ncbi:MAG TPA: MFS transporter [Acidimicrobiales bacterium]|jgi:EmrB/QacA subfamily drug resistance transporter|nr:MFS transporter [Acidimicrobiales bacterium]
MPTLERKWWTLIAVCTAIFMLLLDITVVNVALPDIQRSLHSSFSDLQWVVDAYSLTLAAFLLTSGVVGDIFGRREVFAVGLAVFSAASLVCGLSTSSLMLNLARAVQGVGGAIMFATSLALIAAAFQGKDRGTAFGIFGAITGGAVAIGPLVGGAITSGIGWRWIFFVNVPIGIVAIFLTLTRIAESKDTSARTIDWVGFLSFSLSLFALVFALVRGNDEGWSSTTIVTLFIAAAVLMAIFFINESRRSDPMLDLGLFRRPAFVGVSLVAFCLSASIFAMFLYLTLYIQDDLGYGPFPAGVRFLPLTVLSFVVAPIAGRLTTRLQSRYLLGFGMLLIAGGLLLMAFTHPDSTYSYLIPGFFVTGAGIGMVNPVLASGAISVVEHQKSGMASGSNNTFRQVGIATGIAILGAIFQSQIVSRTSAVLAQSATGQSVLHQGGSQLSAALGAGGVHQLAAHIPVAAARTTLLRAYHIGFSSTLNHLMIIAAIVAFAGCLAGFGLVRQRDFVAAGGGAVGTGAPGGGDGAAPVSSHA